MEEVPTFKVNAGSGNVLVKNLTQSAKQISVGIQSSTTEAANFDPMKVFCIPMETTDKFHLLNDCIGDDKHSMHQVENSSTSKRAVRWGPVECITNQAASPNRDETPVHVVSISQPVKIELPAGFMGAPRLAQPLSTSILLQPDRRPHARAVETRKLPLAHSLVETQKPSFFSIPPVSKHNLAEEESTACSNSDPEPLASANSEDDSFSGSEEQQPPGTQDRFVRSISEDSFAHPPGLQPPPGIPSLGSAMHGSGMCQPCAWFWKPSGCAKLGGCQHCHLCPSGELKTRKKNKHLMMRLGLATPKSKSTPKDVDDQENKICSLNFFLPGFFMPDNLAPKEELMLSGPTLPDAALKMDNRQYSEELHLLEPKAEQNFPASPQRPPPGLQPPANTPNHGSLFHGTGNCKPCAWFWKPGGCQKKQDCTHCHLCPEGEVKARKNAKLTMMRLGLATPKGGPQI